MITHRRHKNRAKPVGAAACRSASPWGASGSPAFEHSPAARLGTSRRIWWGPVGPGVGGSQVRVSGPSLFLHSPTWALGCWWEPQVQTLQENMAQRLPGGGLGDPLPPGARCLAHTHTTHCLLLGGSGRSQTPPRWRSPHRPAETDGHPQEVPNLPLRTVHQKAGFCLRVPQNLGGRHPPRWPWEWGSSLAKGSPCSPQEAWLGSVSRSAARPQSTVPRRPRECQLSRGTGPGDRAQRWQRGVPAHSNSSGSSLTKKLPVPQGSPGGQRGSRPGDLGVPSGAGGG